MNAYLGYLLDGIQTILIICSVPLAVAGIVSACGWAFTADDEAWATRWKSVLTLTAPAFLICLAVAAFIPDEATRKAVAAELAADEVTK